MNFVIIGVFAVIVLSLLIVVSGNNKNKSLADSHIKEISYSEYKDRVKDDNYTIFLFAQPGCSHCQAYKPFVNLLAEENDLVIYYINVASADLKDEEYYELRSSITATKNEYDSDGNPVIPTPATAIFKSGVEVDSILGDIGYDGLEEFLKNNGVI